MNIPKIYLAAIAVTLLSTSAVYAEPLNDHQAPAKLQMISGGIGEDEIAAIHEAEKDYSLKLVFAEKSGEYLANVGIQIVDSKHKTVVNTASDGPIVLLNLQPGTYTLVSTINGEQKSQKINVRQSGLSTYMVRGSEA